MWNVTEFVPEKGSGCDVYRDTSLIRNRTYRGTSLIRNITCRGTSLMRNST